MHWTLVRVPALLLLISVMCPLTLAAASIQELEEFLGAWEVEMTMMGDTITSVLTFTRTDDGLLKGTWEGPRGKSDLEQVKYGDGRITFKRSFGSGARRGVMSHNVWLEDDHLVGKITTPRGEREYSGQRMGTE